MVELSIHGKSFLLQINLIFRFIYKNSIYYLISYEGEADEIILPMSINGNSYVIDTFKSFASKITIPDNMKTIGEQAFYNCSYLTSVTIPDSVTSIENGAFYNCYNLQNVIGGNNVTNIGSNAFFGCSNLTNIALTSNLKSIGNSAFENCTNLSSIIIPDSVIIIGDLAFYNTAIYNNFNNWIDGALYIGNHLICVDEDIESFDMKEKTIISNKNVFSKCYKLKEIFINNLDVNLQYCTNLVVLKIDSINLSQNLHNIFQYNVPITLRKIILCENVKVLEI